MAVEIWFAYIGQLSWTYTWFKAGLKGYVISELLGSAVTIGTPAILPVDSCPHAIIMFQSPTVIFCSNE